MRIWDKGLMLLRPQHAGFGKLSPVDNPQLKEYKEKGVIDSGCSRHMTGNKSYLTDYEDYDGGLVSFGDGKGRISGKGKIKTGKLDFDNVHFCKELKYNMFSVSQMCDKKNNVLFTDTECLVLSSNFKLLDESQVLLRVPRKDNIYSIDLKSVVPTGGLTCLFAKSTIDESNLWHRRLGHINYKTMNKLKGKQHKASYKAKLVNSISKPLHMLHMDLFGPTNVKSLMKKSYCLVVTDDFSRFSWVFFLATKDETSGILKTFITGIENQLDCKVKVIRCDNGTEFKNSVMNQFCDMKGIKREFSVARTPQQNGVAERKNKTLIEAARTMLVDSKLPTIFWAEVVNTACYVLNRALVIKPYNKTPYELIRGRPPLIDFMKPFGCPVTILNTRDHLGKFDGKADEGFFVGYSVNRNGPDWLFDIDSLTKSMNYVPVIAGYQANNIAGTIYNIVAGQGEKKKAHEQEYIIIPLCLTDPLISQGPKNSDDDAGLKPTEVNKGGTSNNNNKDGQDARSESERIIQKEKIFGNAYDDEDVEEEVDINNVESSYAVPDTSITKFLKNHPKDQVIGSLETPVQTRHMSKINEEHGLISSVQQLRRTNHKDFQNYLPKDKWAIGTKWVFKNKKDKRGIVVKNKVRLVAQGYTQEEGIDYEEVFALVARIEAIRLFLAYASFNDFVVYRMDVKSAFLYGKIEEEVYFYQPPGFEDPTFPDKVYKVEKALYGLHEAPRACIEFEKLMHDKFQMSSMGELTFFLGLQVQQKHDGIFISQDKYVAEILKKFDFATVKTTSTPMEPNKALVKDEESEDVDVHLYRSMIDSLIYLKGQPKLGLWYPKDSPFDLEAYSDSDYARASLDKKSTTGGCQFLGKRLISWQCKKQTIVANSTTEAEYVATTNCCGQITKISQSSGPTNHVADEIVHKELGDRMERAAIIASSFEAECQETTLGVADAQTRFETVSIKSNNPPLSRGNTLGSGEDSMKLKELTASYTKLLENCKILFWATAKVKKVNGQDQIQALVDKKKVLITEESIRSDLHFADAEANNQKFNFSKYILANMVKNLEGGVKFFMFLRFLQRKMIKSPQHEFGDEDHVPTFSNNPLPNGENSSDLNELMVFCLSLQEQVLNLQKAKDAQAKEINSLKKTVKKLQRKRRSRPAGLRRLRIIGDSRRSKSSKDNKGLGDHEDSSKQGRNNEYIGQDKAQEQLNEEMFGVKDPHGKEVTIEDTTEVIVQDTVIETITAAEEVTTISGPTTKTINELTLAQTLIEIAAKSKKVEAVTTAATSVTTAAMTRPKAKGIFFHEHEQSHRSTVSSTQPSSKDKGKGIMTEPEKPLKRKYKVAVDEEYAKQLAVKMEAELVEEERDRRQKEEEANLALIELWETKQAMMEADRLLAERIQSREREELIIEEKSKLFVELMNKRKKHFAELRAQEKRNRPPTKPQKRNQMSTYLKHMRTYKYSHLKNKTYEEIERLFEIEMKRVNTFIPIDQDVESSKKDKAKNKSKRAGEELESDVSKKQKADESPSIIDYKIHKEGKKKYFQIIRADGNSKNYLTFGQMFKNFNKDDLEDLWKIVKSRFMKKDPVDDMYNLLLRTVNTMFEPQNIVYYLLVEKTYPLTRNTLHQLWNDVRLQVDYEVEMAYELLSIKLILLVLTTACAQFVLLVIKIQLLSNYNSWKDYDDIDMIKDMSEKR
ncbi:putative ribonuclease H-like domain-containing protein [Tanacetum coccineum]